VEDLPVSLLLLIAAAATLAMIAVFWLAQIYGLLLIGWVVSLLS
jgi:hypothetical protein